MNDSSTVVCIWQQRSTGTVRVAIVLFPFLERCCGVRQNATLRYYWLLLINHPVRLPSLKTSLSNNRDSCELDHGAFIIVEGQMRHVRSMVLHL
jgi:hypothetical protein